MRKWLIFLLIGMLLLSGCRYQVVENSNRQTINAPAISPETP